MTKTALSATQKRREAEHAKKLLKGRQLLEQYGKVQRRANGKAWFLRSHKGDMKKWLIRVFGNELLAE